MLGPLLFMLPVPEQHHQPACSCSLSMGRVAKVAPLRVFRHCGRIAGLLPFMFPVTGKSHRDCPLRFLSIWRVTRVAPLYVFFSLGTVIGKHSLSCFLSLSLGKVARAAPLHVFVSGESHQDQPASHFLSLRENHYGCSLLCFLSPGRVNRTTPFQVSCH